MFLGEQEMQLGRNGRRTKLRQYSSRVNPVLTEWILVDVRIGSLTHGYAHGTVHLWSENRELLATASQTCQYRSLD